jgi:hypothetical protein
LTKPGSYLRLKIGVFDAAAGHYRTEMGIGVGFVFRRIIICFALLCFALLCFALLCFDYRSRISN